MFGRQNEFKDKKTWSVNSRYFKMAIFILTMLETGKEQFQEARNVLLENQCSSLDFTSVWLWTSNNASLNLSNFVSRMKVIWQTLAYFPCEDQMRSLSSFREEWDQGLQAQQMNCSSNWKVEPCVLPVKFGDGTSVCARASQVRGSLQLLWWLERDQLW